MLTALKSRGHVHAQLVTNGIISLHRERDRVRNKGWPVEGALRSTILIIMGRESQKLYWSESFHVVPARPSSKYSMVAM
jgi:hypothetical protein